MKTKNTLSQRLINLAYMKGGGTLSKDNKFPTKGYYVGINNIFTGPFPEYSTIKAIQYKIDLTKGKLFGSWRKKGANKAPDILYIDQVMCYYDLEKALKIARSHKELAIWDIKNKKEIEVNYE